MQERPSQHGSLWLLPSGPLAPNPSELLETPEFDELIRELKRRFDVVLIDSPPVTLVSDPSVVAAKVDGTILVVGLGRARKGDLRRAVEQLESVNARVVGVVLNRMKSPQRSAYYGYGYRTNGTAPTTTGKAEEMVTVSEPEAMADEPEWWPQASPMTAGDFDRDARGDGESGDSE
jgi:Mrp family chromosome partitioning ATPase